MRKCAACHAYGVKQVVILNGRRMRVGDRRANGLQALVAMVCRESAVSNGILELLRTRRDVGRPWVRFDKFYHEL